MYNDAVSIREKAEKIKHYALNERLFSAFLIVVVGIAGYGLGRLSMKQENSGTVIRGAAEDQVVKGKNTVSNLPHTNTITAEPGTIEGGYVASKNSNKYHLPWCSGAQSISEANKIWFSTKEEAEEAGYQPAGNCKGI